MSRTIVSGCSNIAGTSGFPSKKRTCEYVKTAFLNGKWKVRALIDLGSRYSLIKLKLITKYRLKQIEQTKILVGTGQMDNLVPFLFIVKANLTINNASAGIIPMISVNNKAIKYDIVVGRDWLGHPKINFKKELGWFLISTSHHSHMVSSSTFKIPDYKKMAKINGTCIEMMIDTGSHHNIIKRTIALEIGLNLEDLFKPRILSGISEGWFLTIRSKARVVISVDKVSAETYIYIVDDMIPDGIIGRSWLNNPKVKFCKGAGLIFTENTSVQPDNRISGNEQN